MSSLGAMSIKKDLLDYGSRALCTGLVKVSGDCLDMVIRRELLMKDGEVDPLEGVVIISEKLAASDNVKILLQVISNNRHHHVQSVHSFETEALSYYMNRMDYARVATLKHHMKFPSDNLSS